MNTTAPVLQRTLTIILFSGIGFAVSLPAAADEIPAKACFVRVLEKSDVSALERGALQTIAVEPGDAVTEGSVIATLDDTTAALTLEQARLDLAVAKKQHEESLAVEVAEADLSQAAGQLRQAVVEADIADRVAGTDLAERIAAKDAELSEDELNRITVARKAFVGSVSQQQIVQLTITHSQNQLKIEQARYERELNLLRAQSRKSLIEQHQAARDRLTLELKQARSDRDVMELTLQSLTAAVRLAEEGLNRRRITAPLSGVVVERLRHAGEWVEPGEPVFRIIRLDRLQVEGYVDVDLARSITAGSQARITAPGQGATRTTTGRILFVSPEVDSVNRQVLVRAGIGNADLTFRPGEAVQMTIVPGAPPRLTN